MRPSHNLPIPPEYLLLSHYMQRSHNISPPPPPLNIYMRHSQNSPSDSKYTPTLNYPLPPRIGYPPFLKTTCDTSIIHPSLSEYTPFYIKCGSQNLPHLSSIYPPFSTTICDAPRLYPALPEYTPPPPPLEMRPSQNLPILSESTPFFTTICDTPIIDPSLP